MTVIITMAGSGSRFRNQGYDVPKHMIKAKGKTLFEWSMESLKSFYNHHFIFACLSEQNTQWIKNKCNDLGITNVTVAPRNKLSNGQAETAYDVLNNANPDEQLWIFNIDTFIEKGLNPSDMNEHHGCVPVIKSENPSMSFVKYDEDGYVIELAEKKVISNWATVGIYGFKSASLYKALYEKAYLEGAVSSVNGERYIAPIYQLLIAGNKSVCAPKLCLSSVHILGTPNELLSFDPNATPPFGHTNNPCNE